MSDTTYNGWQNYATWRINLEICDDTIQSLVADRTQFASAYALRDHLDETVDDIISDYGELEGLAVDYARAFLDDVNFSEIAEHAIADNPELLESDEDDDEEAEA